MSDPRIKYEELLEKPIIIFGSGRSGTTIISEIIFQHEQLAWHNNYQELFTHSALINYVRRIFDNKFCFNSYFISILVNVMPTVFIFGCRKVFMKYS